MTADRERARASSLSLEEEPASRRTDDGITMPERPFAGALEAVIRRGENPRW